MGYVTNFYLKVPFLKCYTNDYKNECKKYNENVQNYELKVLKS